MVEFVLCIPFFALLIAGIFFLGWAMRNQQKVRTADRYAAWRSVHDRTWSNNDLNMEGQIDGLFFADQGIGVDHSENGGPTDTREDYQVEAGMRGPETGEFCEDALTHLSQGRRARVSSDFESDSIYKFASGAIESSHVRDGRSWRYHEGSIRESVRDLYLEGLEDAVDNIHDGTMRRSVHTLYYYGW
jgi:hypothetical protein